MINLINNILKNTEDFRFFQIEVIADFEFEGKIFKNHRHYNNNSILTSINWEQHKETFFSQRMNYYKESYTLLEKIKLEIETIENITIIETDYKILKDRYKLFLLNNQNILQETQKIEFSNSKNIKSKHNPNLWNEDCFELFEYLFSEYYKGTIRQITNIWFFLNEYDRNNSNRKYVLKCTKNDFKDFIKKEYEIIIKNFDKATAKYEDKEFPTLKEHLQNFENLTLK